MSGFNSWVRKIYFPQFVIFTVIMIIVISVRMALKDTDSVITFPKLVAVIIGISMIFGLVVPLMIKGIDLFFDGLFGLIGFVSNILKNENNSNDR